MAFTDRKKKYFISIIVFLVIPLLSLSADMALDDFASSRSLDIYWDPFAREAVLKNNTTSVELSGQHEFVTVNYSTKHQSKALKFVEGRWILENDTYNLLNELFPEQSNSSRSISAIFIDAGHGGKDSGALRTHGSGDTSFTLKEKDINLFVANRLTELLGQRYPQIDIIQSRSDDLYLSLEERTNMANVLLEEYEGQVLYISIHANAAFNQSASGFEVWHLPTDHNRELIDPETVSEDQRPIIPILNTLMEEELTVEGIILAQMVSRHIESSVGIASENRGLRQMDWFVVRNARMPSILIELGYITNPNEAALLNNESYLNRLAEGIYNGIGNFIQDFESVN